MSDMQKVRVSLTDAEGKVHEVVGYRRNAEIRGVFMRDDDKATGINASVMVQWVDDQDVTVTPIQELPTGLGAVVEVTYDDPEGDLTTERYVRIEKGTWYTPEVGEDVTDNFLKAQKFTVLSEGIK